VDLERIRFHETAWSMDVPHTQKVDASAVESLRKISSRLQKQDIVDLLFKSWLVESHYYQLRLAHILEQPRDYQWLRFLAQDMGHRFTMADYVTADLKQFDQAEIEQMIRSAGDNHKQFSYDMFLLALLSATREELPI